MVSASASATAIAVRVCIWGPPWRPGKTALSRFFALFSFDSRIPPLGPRRVLCVVVETMSAYGTGLLCIPATTSPAMCAMSLTWKAPASFAIWPKISKSISLGYAVAPEMMSFGLCFFASSAILS